MVDEQNVSGFTLVLFFILFTSLISIVFVAPNFNRVSWKQWEVCEALCLDNPREVYPNGDCKCRIDGSVVEVEP